MTSVQTVTRKPRTFLPDDFVLTDWASIQPYFDELSARNIESKHELEQWFLDRSEAESFLMEDMAWRYIQMTCHTAEEKYQHAFQFFVQQIQPELAALDDALNQKALASPFLDELTGGGFAITVRSMRKAVEIFREENIPLQTQIQTEQTKYQALTGAMLVEINGENLTVPQATTLLQSTDRALREQVWTKLAERRLQDKDAINDIFDELVRLRHQVAVQAGFANFRDYMFAAMGRFDYTPTDCFRFHDAVQETVVPLVQEMAEERKKVLQVDVLRPWDKKVDPQKRPALVAFESATDLIEKTAQCLEKLDVSFGNYIRIMREMGHFDVESRPNKAPGGYNYPMAEVGVPFIFMNATNSLRDLVTMEHEAGHAVHSFLTKDLPIQSFKSTPSEVAELASMSMELLSMDHWDVFFSDESACRRAKMEHLEDILSVLPWIAVVDKFQHRLYENPAQTQQEREVLWINLVQDFSDTVTDYSGLEEIRASEWHRQLHIFEVPFYYIEYGMAQLGAIQVWRNYKNNPKKALEGYKRALQLGYTATIGEIYAAADIKFDFSKDNIQELMNFVNEELRKLRSNP